MPMRFTVIALSISVALLSLQCNNNSTGPQSNAFFSVGITVKNSSGFPIPGLRISCWNKLPLLNSSVTRAFSVDKVLSTTSIHFSVPKKARLTLSVFNMDNTVVSSLIDHEEKQAGVYAFNWSVNMAVPTRVFRYQLVAQDSSESTTYFDQSKYAVLWQPDPSISILGWTSADGTFATRDTLAFPNVLAHRSYNVTNDSPDIIAIFAFSDTLIFTLTDTTTHTHLTYQRVVQENTANQINLLWDPASAVPEPLSQKGDQRQQAPLIQGEIVPGVGLPTDWQLTQNYPNPFN